VKEACRLLKVAMQQAATDPLTGESPSLSRLNPVFQDPEHSEGGLRFATFTDLDELDCRDEVADCCFVSKPFARVSHSESVRNHLSCPILSLGAIDMDLITTGVSASERSRRGLLTTALRNWILDNLQEGAGPVRVNQVSGKNLQKSRVSSAISFIWISSEASESIRQNPFFGFLLRVCKSWQCLTERACRGDLPRRGIARGFRRAPAFGKSERGSCSGIPWRALVIWESLEENTPLGFSEEHPPVDWILNNLQEGAGQSAQTRRVLIIFRSVPASGL
jgi:hypothetical protein